MRGLVEALAFLGCLFGGAVLASFILVAATVPHFGLVHPGESQHLSRDAFMAVAQPAAAVIGAVVGGVICLRGQRKATPRKRTSTVIVVLLAVTVFATFGLLFFIGKRG
jgi:hypothetical protein